MDDHTGDDIWGGQILLISEDTDLRGLYIHAIELLGGRCATSPLDFEADELAAWVNIAAVIVHISAWDDIQQNALEQAEKFCESSHLPLLIRTDLALLDTVLAAVEYPNVEHLLSDSVAELFVSLEHRTKRPISSLFADRDNVDLVDLKKISADVERIARAIVKLSGPEQPIGERRLVGNPFKETDEQARLADTPIGFKAGSSADLQGLDSNQPAERMPTISADGLTAEDVRGLIRARRLRDAHFDPELFADPAWDMLLDLMAARLEGTKVAVSSLCIAAAVPPTTALRWIKTMTEENIFQRKADEKDGRRIFIELSDEAAAGMTGFFSMVRRERLLMI